MKRVIFVVVSFVLFVVCSVIYTSKELEVNGSVNINVTEPVVEEVIVEREEYVVIKDLDFYIDSSEFSRLLHAMAEVESEHKSYLIGDKHLKNMAYGAFQMRQPAVDDVNRVYKLNLIASAKELLDSEELQVLYAEKYLLLLFEQCKDLKIAIHAYNMGMGNAKNSKKRSKNTYYAKVVKAYANKPWLD